MSKSKTNKTKTRQEVGAGRAFAKGVPNPAMVESGELTEIGNCSPAQRMFFILKLGDHVAGLVNQSKGRGRWAKSDITPEEGEKIWSEECTINFFRFIDNNLTVEEIITLVHLMSKTLDMSFTLFHRTDAFTAFATKMRDYLRGSI